MQPLRPPAEPGEGSVRAAVHETYDDELAWLPGEVQKAHAGLAEPSWAEIGVLVRDNAHAADVFDALTRAEIPVEIVGLQGLLRLPEVAEVVASLTLLHDLTANAALLTLLTGPRWSIGPRDLALLGRRAARPGRRRRPRRARPRPRRRRGAGRRRRRRRPDRGGLPHRRARRPRHGDPWTYSPEARERFALLSGELRSLRAHAGEPLLDLVRRIIDTTGIDIELASSVSPAAQARRDNLDLFVKAVAEFQAVDGEVTLPALLAYLQAEDELGNGLDVATPTEADSVKLLTVHRAKGLEWDAVFLVGVVDGRFPNTRGRTKWTSGPAVLPTPLRGDARDLPRLAGHTPADLDAVAGEWKRHEAQEELRLGYVAFTRARHELVVSSYLWGPTQQKPLGPSPYQATVREMLREWGGDAEQWLDAARGRRHQPDARGRRRGPGRSRATRPRSSGGSVAAGVVRSAIERARAGGGAGRRGPRRPRGDPGRRVGRRDGAAARRGPARPRRRGRRAAALQPVRDGRGPAARRPGAVRRRPGAADAPAALARGAVRHPVPRLGRGPLRPAAAPRPRRAARPRATPGSRTTRTCRS